MTDTVQLRRQPLHLHAVLGQTIPAAFRFCAIAPLKNNMTSFILKSVQDRPTSYPPIDKQCTFCRIISHRSEAHVVYEDDLCMAFLGEMGRVSNLNMRSLPESTDIYPLRAGHTLLIPKQHYARLADLPSELGEAMGRALPRITKAINEGGRALLRRGVCVRTDHFSIDSNGKPGLERGV